MYSLSERIREIESELSGLTAGYISKKRIGGKDRFYLQWTENGKLKSRYIKVDEYDSVSAQVEKRRRLQEELKSLKDTPEGVREQKLKRKAARNMLNITGTIMIEDRAIAAVKNGEITDCDESLVPLYLKRTGDVEGWLASRAIDAHRTNSRLLKRALRMDGLLPAPLTRTEQIQGCLNGRCGFALRMTRKLPLQSMRRRLPTDIGSDRKALPPNMRIYASKKISLTA